MRLNTGSSRFIPIFEARWSNTLLRYKPSHWRYRAAQYYEFDTCETDWENVTTNGSLSVPMRHFLFPLTLLGWDVWTQLKQYLNTKAETYTQAEEWICAGFCLFACFCTIFQGRLRGDRWGNDGGSWCVLSEKSFPIKYHCPIISMKCHQLNVTAL